MDNAQTQFTGKSPSAWSKRVSLVLLALLGGTDAGYLALHQMGVVTHVWEPIFGEGSRVILHLECLALIAGSGCCVGCSWIFHRGHPGSGRRSQPLAYNAKYRLRLCRHSRTIRCGEPRADSFAVRLFSCVVQIVSRLSCNLFGDGRVGNG